MFSRRILMAVMGSLQWNRDRPNAAVLECHLSDGKGLAPWAGVEPATFRLTVERSTAELPGNAAIVDSGGAITKAYRRCKAAFLRCRRPFARAKADRQAGQREWREDWRPRPELNRGTRICSPLRHHSATWPRHRYIGRVAGRQHAAAGRACLPFDRRCRKSRGFHAIGDHA
jgi:hypothetical protein